MEIVAGITRRGLLLLVILTGLMAAPVLAQVGPALQFLDTAAQPDNPPARHQSRYRVSPGLYTAEGQAAAQAFRRAKAEGRAAHRVNHPAFDVGDTLSFNTRRLLNFGWERRHFTLMFEGSGFNLWVETAELDNDHVQEADVNALADALVECLAR